MPIWNECPTLKGQHGRGKEIAGIDTRSHPRREQFENPLVRAACCGRLTNADMVLDLSAMPPGIRKQFRFGEQDVDGEPVPVACDACRERAIREGRITREEFYRQLGAPQAVLDRVNAYSQRRGFKG